MAPPAAEPAKSAAQKTAERLSEENAAMKREAVEQEERLKRLHAKIQKMEQDMAGLLRKRGTLGQGAAASAAVRGARDVETERLEAAIHDRQFHIDAISKQLLIIKHTAHGPRKPLSSIYGADRKDAASPYGTAAAAPARRPQSAGGRKGAGAALVSNASEGEMREILATLKRECNSAAERLREARRKAEARASAKDGAEQRDRVLEGKTPDEIRRALEEMKAKTVMLEATEDHRAVTLKNAKEAVERTEPVVQRLKDEHVEVQRKLVDLNHQKKLVELRKVRHLVRGAHEARAVLRASLPRGVDIMRGVCRASTTKSVPKSSSSAWSRMSSRRRIGACGASLSARARSSSLCRSWATSRRSWQNLRCTIRICSRSCRRATWRVKRPCQSWSPMRPILFHGWRGAPGMMRPRPSS